MAAPMPLPAPVTIATFALGRREKSGELVGLRRLRAFTMPDCHAFCRDLEQAKQEFRKRFELSISVLQAVGLSTEDVEMAIRF